MESEKVIITKSEYEEFERLRLWQSKLGMPKKTFNKRLFEIIDSNHLTKSITEMFNICIEEKLDISYSAFRKLVIEEEIKSLFFNGKEVGEIVDILKIRRKHSRMNEERVEKVLKEVLDNKEAKRVKSQREIDEVDSFIRRMRVWRKKNISIPIKIDEVEGYKIILMSQGDNSIIDVPLSVLTLMGYKRQSVISGDNVGSNSVELGSIILNNKELIILVRFKPMTMPKIQLIKSCVPIEGKKYEKIIDTVAFIKNLQNPIIFE